MWICLHFTTYIIKFAVVKALLDSQARCRVELSDANSYTVVVLKVWYI